MRPNISVYAILFFVSLIAAYFASENRADQSQPGQRWLSLNASDLKDAAYQDDKGNKLEIKRLENGSYWVFYEASGKPETEFKARDTVQEIARFWAELRALRVIGEANNLTLEEFGLQENNNILSLTFGDKEYRFLIGKQGFQTQNHFILDQQRQQVIVVARRGIQPFQNVMNELFERDILGLDLEKVEQVEVRAKEKQFLFSNKGKGSDGEINWQREDDEEDSGSSWLNRMLRLQVRSYEGLDRVAELDQQEELLHMRFMQSGKAVEELVVRAVASETGENFEYRLKSQHTNSYVRLNDSRVETLIKDLEAM